MLVDLHAHTSGISLCCKASAPEVIEAAKGVGLGGIVLTNHYQKSYVPDGNYADFAKRYIEEYRYTKALGKELGCRVFFGIEVTMERYDRVHLLIYGVDEKFVEQYPDMFDYSQEQLYRTVHENGGLLIQAHPLRRGKNALLDLSLLDGVEVNSHPKYDGTHIEELTELAEKNGLILTSGGDYHADTHRPCCGLYLPDTIASSEELGAYLRAARELELCYQEPQDRHCQRATFRPVKR